MATIEQLVNQNTNVARELNFNEQHPTENTGTFPGSNPLLDMNSIDFMSESL